MRSCKRERWFLAGMLLLALTASCSAGPETSVGAATSPSPSVSDEEVDRSAPVAISRPKTPATKPKRWVAVRRAGDKFEAVLFRRTRALRVLARWPVKANEETPGRLLITDIAMTPVQERAYVATCCEPVSGSVWRVSLRAGRRGHTYTDQGHAVDAAGKAYARADKYGTLVVYPRGPQNQRGDFLAGGIAAHQVALRPGGGQASALIDPRRSSNPTDTGRARLLTVTRKVDGGWKRGFTKRDRRYCALVYLSPTKLGLLRGKRSGRSAVNCRGSRIDALNLSNGRLTKGVLRLPRVARHLSTDSSGAYVIYTTRTGSVRWITRDGRRGRLTGGRFVAADW